MKSDDAPVIDVPARGGLRGRMDRLQQTYMQKATALQIAIEILDADDRAAAQELAPRKFQQAITHRTGLAPDAPLTTGARIAQYVSEHPGASTTDIAQSLGVVGGTVLKHIWEIAKPVKKEKRGSRNPLRWLLKDGASAPTATQPRSHKKKKNGGKHIPEAERRNILTSYLLKHPGADTNTAAEALGWHVQQVRKIAAMVARGEGGTSGTPRKWYISAPKMSKKKTARANGAVKRKKVVKLPRGERVEMIKNYLRDHPEAFTVEIGKAIGRTPNSSLIKLIRTVAKPARETLATQPIPWVLTEA